MNKNETKFFEYVDAKKGCKVIKAVTTYEGKYVSATACTHPNDEYEYEVGKMIAETRLDIKIARKRATSMRRRATRYGYAVVAYKNAIDKMKKEMNKALSVADKRDAEADALEEKLEKLLANL